MDESFPERCKLHPHDTEVAGIPWTCLFYMYPYIRTYPTTRNRQKVKMEMIKINTNLTTSTKTWRYYFFGSVFWSCNFRFTGTTSTLEGHLPIGGSCSSSSTEPWMRSSQHPAELLTQGHGKRGPVTSIYYWPNGIIFHQHLDFPEIFGDFPYEKPPFGGQSVVFSVAIIWPDWTNPP